jgi:hypothetical protein
MVRPAPKLGSTNVTSSSTQPWRAAVAVGLALEVALDVVLAALPPDEDEQPATASVAASNMANPQTG